MALLNSTKERRAVTHQMWASVRLYPNLCLCLMCYWFWQGSLFQSPQAFLSTEPAIPGGAPSWASLIFLVFNLATYVAVALAHKSLATVMKRKGYPVALAVLMGIGGLGLIFGAPFLPKGISFAFSAILGVTAALFVCELGRVFAQLGPYRTLYVGGLGTLGGMLLNVAAAFLPGAFMQFALVLTAPAAVTLCMRSRRLFSCATIFPESYSILQAPKRLNATCLLQGIAFGVFTTLLAAAAAGNHSIVYMLASPVGVAALTIAVMLVSMDFNNLLYRTALPLLAFGFLLHALFPEIPEVGGFAFNVGYAYVYVITTCICSYFGKELGCSPIWIVALITAFLVGGQLVGLVATPLLLGGENELLTSGQIGAIASCLIPVTGLFLLDKDNQDLGWGAVVPSDFPNTEEDKDGLLYSSRSLTARETDVARLLARGLTKRYIAQQLGISEETVKTHIGSVYRKLGVHSQQELIIMIDSGSHNSQKGQSWG